MRRAIFSTRPLGGLLLVLLCSGPVLNCGCDEPFTGRPQLVVDKTVLQFDDVAVGWPQTRTMTVANDGRIGLAFDKLAPAGGDESPFKVLGDLRASLGPGGTMEIVVEYNPATEDADDFDILEILTNDEDPCPSENNQCEIQLNGTGAPPDAALDVVCQQDDNCPLGDTPVCRVILDNDTLTYPVRVAFNFCEVPAGTNRELAVLLANAGNIPLTMDGFALEGSEFFAILEPDQEEIEPIKPGESRMLTIVYAPQEEGAHQGRMDIQTNDMDLVYDGFPDGTFSVRLLALSAEPDIDVNPTNIPFSEVTQGSQATVTVRVNNTGNAILVVSGLEVTGGTMAGEFSIDPSEGFEIAGGGTALIDVTYAPQDVGADDGSVIIHSNDPDESRVVVTLGGNVRPDLEVTPASVVEFIEVPPAGTETQDVTLRNVGHADLTIGAMGWMTNPQTVFELQGLPGTFPESPIVLAPAEAITFQIRFTDNTLIEDEVGQLNIAHDSPNDVEPYPLLMMSIGTPSNLPPVAVVDPSTQVVHGLQQISLSAANSFDPDPGDSVNGYVWSILWRPVDAQGNESQAVLDSTDQVTTTFTPDMVGPYVVQLAVYDTYNAYSIPVAAEISVNP